MMQSVDENNSSEQDRLAAIWAVIEARNTLPSMILIASATNVDDTTAIARGLADVARSAGQRTGYLRLNVSGRGSASATEYTELVIPTRGSQREAFDAALAAWRTVYDVIIVDVTNVSSVALAAHAARVAQAVVVAICADRRVVAADRELSSLLTELRASVIGVVLSAPTPKPASVTASRDRSRLKPAAQS